VSATVAIVTGASGAIGEAIARNLAARPGYEVVLVCRDEDRARGSIERIAKVTGSTALRYEIADLSRPTSVEALAGRWSGPLHVLVNNAGVTPRRRLETPDGLELQFATNVMGYFWMMQAYAEVLARSAPARVVNVASYYAGDLEVDDLQFVRRRYDNNIAYRQSKQADRMLTVAFARRWRDRGVAVNACHPADVDSRLSNGLGFAGSQSPEQGARTPVWLATGEAGQDTTGKYFASCREEPCRFGADTAAVEALYEACARLSPEVAAASRP